MGAHITLIKDTLLEMKKGFEKIVEDRELVNLPLAVNDTDKFSYVRQHCPTIDTGYTVYLVQVGLLENRLNALIAAKTNERDINEIRELIRSKIRQFLNLIDKCLQKHEYTKNKCAACPKNPLELNQDHATISSL